MSKCNILQAKCSGVYVLKLVGEVRLNQSCALDASIHAILSDIDFSTIVVDLSETTLVDSTTLGLLAKLAIAAKKNGHFMPSLVSTNPDITTIINSMGFQNIYLIVKEPALSHDDFCELNLSEGSEIETKNKVIEAHKVLMNLNEHNRELFQDLVAVLENGCSTEAASRVG